MMSTQPTTIETITLTTGEQRIAEKKQALIMTALHTGDALPTKDTFVELSDREINALIQQLSGWDTSPLKMTVDISSGTLGMR